VGADHYPVPRDDIERRIVERARRDADFRALLETNPKAALEEVIGAVLPARLEVRVVEESPDCMYIVLPVDLSGISMMAARVATGDHTIGAAR
jgi:hypothetical protein